MKVAIMQPYFLPYIGYFQLISAVDVFVIYDDVNYIKQGWIHKNRIIVKKDIYNLTLQLNGASSFKKINEILIGNNRLKLIKTIEESYKKAPQFKDVYPIILKICSNDKIILSQFLVDSIKIIASYLDIKTKFVISSEISKNNELKGQNKVIEICKKLDASTYVNAIGGVALYDKNIFNEHGIKLEFLKSNSIEYEQFGDEFKSWLSILDVLMFNSKEAIHQMLNEYELV